MCTPGRPHTWRKYGEHLEAGAAGPGYQPPDLDDAIAHWMKYDSWQPPSRPHTTFPQTRGYRSARPAMTGPQALQRHERSAMWFELYRRGGRIILHHGHIRSVLVRE